MVDLGKYFIVGYLEPYAEAYFCGTYGTEAKRLTHGVAPFCAAS